MTTYAPTTTNADRRPWLTEQQVAEHYGLSADGLRYMRRAGTGPTYRKFGRAVRYHRDDLDQWEKSCRVDPAE